jgi:hypothetical protein
MDCQSGCPLKCFDFACFPGANLASACPAPGQCLNVGISESTRIVLLFFVKVVSWSN